MIQGLTPTESADYGDALCRLRQPWRETTHIPSPPPWSTLSGFADQNYFLAALAKVWPMFPPTGDAIALLKIYRWSWPIIPMPTLTQAIPSDELSN